MECTSSSDKGRRKELSGSDGKRKKSSKNGSGGISGSKTGEVFDFAHKPIKANGETYHPGPPIGRGSFGLVLQATSASTGELVAIKKVLQDKRFKNRELQIMSMLKHPCIVTMLNSFYTSGRGRDEVYLNLVLDYVPETVNEVCRRYRKQKKRLPMVLVKLYIYQLCRALAHIHSLGICHRDIKPQNLLINTSRGILKLCDFGSAKILVEGEPNVAYICSRYYRAPELIFGSRHYKTSIDVWSMGCVFAELLLMQPLFPGNTGVEQLVEIIKVLGTPTKEEVHAMNPSQAETTKFKIPDIEPHPWEKLLPKGTPTEAIDLLTNFLTYVPGERIDAFEALSHPFFDELRDPGTRLPSGRRLPNVLFNFSTKELSGHEDLIPKLIPKWAMDDSRYAPYDQPHS